MKRKIYYAEHKARDGIKGYGEGATPEEARRAAVADAYDRVEIENTMQDTRDKYGDDLAFWAVVILIILMGAIAFLIFGVPDIGVKSEDII